MELFWLKNEGNGEVEAFLCKDSKLQLDLIARRWNLDSWTLRFGRIALERLGNGESRWETGVIRSVASDAGLGDGQTEQTAIPVSGKIKVSSEDRVAGIPYWGYSDLLKIPPSSCDNKKARTLQEDADEPAVLNFRPSEHKPQIPLQLAHRAFGTFWDIFYGVSNAPQPGKEDYEMFIKLSEECSKYMESENREYRTHVWESWLDYTGLRLKSPFFTGKIVRDTEEDIGYELRVADGLKGIILALILIVEAKLGTCADPCFRLSQHYRLYWAKVGTSGMFTNTSFPAIGIEHVGPFIRVSALANLRQVSLQPLTPFINLLMLQGHDLAAAETGARLCLATKSALFELNEYYQDVIQGKEAASSRNYFEKGIPYPLHGEAICPVRWGEKLVYAIPEKEMVVKYVQRDYGTAVHLAWAEAGYAPQLLGVQPYPGGWTEVRMEHLGGDWTVLQALNEDVADSLRDEVVQVLKRAHRVPVGNSVGVHGDMRDINVMVHLSRDGDLLEVKFIDFDWAREVGGRYPSFMNHAGVNWHHGVGDRKPMLQEHDIQLLSTKQVQQTIR